MPAHAPDRRRIAAILNSFKSVSHKIATGGGISDDNADEILKGEEKDAKYGEKMKKKFKGPKIERPKPKKIKDRAEEDDTIENIGTLAGVSPAPVLGSYATRKNRAPDRRKIEQALRK